MAENLPISTSPEKEKDEIRADLHIEELNLFQEEVPKIDTRKHLLQSIGDLEVARKSSVMFFENKLDLKADLHTKKVNENMFEVTGTEANNDIVNSLQTVTRMEKLSENVSPEKEGMDNIAQCNNDGIREPPQNVSEKRIKRNILKPGEIFQIAEESLPAAIPEIKSDEFPADINAEGPMGLPQKVSERDMEKHTWSPENLDISQKLETIMLADIPADVNLEGLKQIPTDTAKGDAKIGMLQLVQNFKMTERIPKHILSDIKYEHFTVKLNDKRLREMPQIVFKIHTLKYLHLNNNELKTLPENLGSLRNLEILSIEGNGLMSLPSEISLLYKLRVLNISHNQLSHLPKELSKLLTKLPEELSKLICLQEFDISHNALKEIPEGIGELKYLVSLTANNNCINQLPKSIISLSSLQHLNLSGNELVSLPDGLHHLHLLTDINFDGNSLIRPPQEVCKGKQLHTIVRYLESADERDDKILHKVLKIIAGNVPLEHFEFFCQKLQLTNAEIKDLENNRALELEGKISCALGIWKSENQILTPAEMTDQLIRILTMTGLHYLTNKVKALKLYTQAVKF
ncbi:leucine-rich repeat and death domain-containing protein 1 [Alligator mississippiensis]|uniref:Leucine-rich repeat and death domain-containing protein 1 n=1 Tax=Alligator mississippiensis TaxID=8496 RepID=A0A151MQF5_ALLMI|nr:leucine-rich repeat and death domain-containing protein 1 [Alligator mississippiensis]